MPRCAVTPLPAPTDARTANVTFCLGSAAVDPVAVVTPPGEAANFPRPRSFA